MIARYRRWKKRRAHRVECEVCGARMKPSKAVRVVDEGFSMTEIGPGGFFIEATYCQDDAPKEAA